MTNNRLKLFRVEGSERINAYVVTNDDYATVITSRSQAGMLCNMLNRIIKQELGCGFHEKRFRYDSALEKVYDDDTFNGETTESYGVFECCEIMNEQQATLQQVKKVLQEEYGKSDIPVWKHRYIKDIAERVGVLL